MAIEHSDFDGMERLAAATGAEIISTFDSPDRSEEVLGHCALIEEIMIGEDKLIKFSGCKAGNILFLINFFINFFKKILGKACTIVLRGASSHILEEAERSLHDALCVLVATVKNLRVVYGGGNSEI